jgi:molybdate transport system permease protein
MAPPDRPSLTPPHSKTRSRPGAGASRRRLENAPRSLRAGRYIVVFRHATLPLIGPSPATGAVLAWSRALGEFRATITSAGNLPGLTQTVPLAIYISQSSNHLDEAIAAAQIN